jgi:hypothetical protein
MEYLLLFGGLTAICGACLWAYDRMSVRAARDRAMNGQAASPDPLEGRELRHEIGKQVGNLPKIGKLH